MSWYWSISLLDDVVFIPDSLDFTVFYADLAETVDFGMGNCFHLLHKMRQPYPPRIRNNIPSIFYHAQFPRYSNDAYASYPAY